MSKKLTKLSRARPKPKTDSSNKQLNNSDEDFQSVISKPINDEKSSEKPQNSIKISQITQNTTAASESIDQNVTTTAGIAPLQPCPFCSKKFSCGQELTRASHLKSCASQLGVETNQLLEIRKLEDRQAEEWKALNLPKINNVSKNSTTKSSNTSLKVKRAEFQSSNDPNLEIALALSASMASNAGESIENKNEKVEDIKSETVQQCWLPQPPSNVKLPKKTKSKAKTALQVRNEEERNQQITDAVVTVLSYENETISGFGEYVTIKSKLNCEQSHWWTMAALAKSIDSALFQLDLIKPYLMMENEADIEQRKSVVNISFQSNQQQNKGLSENDDNFAKDWLKLFESGSKSDLIIYARDEKAVKAHSLVLFARCQKLLENVIVENGERQVISMPEVSKNVLTAFLKYLYTGQLYLELDNDQDLQDAQYLAQTYPELDYWKKCINDKDLRGFVTDESEDDEKENFENHNLSNLLEILEHSDTSEKGDTSDNNDKNDDEWDEMCQILSQKSNNTGCERSESPDIPLNDDLGFNEADEQFEIQNVIQSSLKRKSSLEISQNDTKKSKLDEQEESFNLSQNCSIYSRLNTSSPSILKDLDLADGKHENRSHSHTPEKFCTTNIKTSPIKTPDPVCDDMMNTSSYSSPIFLETSPVVYPKQLFNTPAKTSPIKTQMEDEPMQTSPFRTPNFLKSSPATSNFNKVQEGRKEVITPVTPHPDYERMLSPALRIELRRYGLKVLPRRNAVPLLKHIYEETHPGVGGRVEFDNQLEDDAEREEFSLSQESNTSAASEDFPEESIVVNDEPNEPSETLDIHDQLLNFIRENSELHRQVLMYEPLWLEDLYISFKEGKSVKKVKINQVQDILDNECITFRTRSRHDKNVKRNAKSKIK